MLQWFKNRHLSSKLNDSLTKKFYKIIAKANKNYLMADIQKFQNTFKYLNSFLLILWKLLTYSRNRLKALAFCKIPVDMINFVFQHCESLLYTVTNKCSPISGINVLNQYFNLNLIQPVKAL